MEYIATWFQRLTQGGWANLLASVVDTVLVWVIIYWLMMLAKRSKAWQIMWGLVVLILILFAASQIGLVTISWLAEKVWFSGPIAIVLLFYPELRHALEEMGKVAGWHIGFSRLNKEDLATVVGEVSAAASQMSQKRVGALIVLERDVMLDDIAATGTPLQAKLSRELLCTVFHPGSVLHDGAVVVRGGQVVAAGCTLPLSESVHIGTMIHTRHKAAIGVSEVSDAVVVVVSEETGTISLATEGRLHSGLSEDSLSKWLRSIFGSEEDDQKSNFKKTFNGTLRRARLR